MNTNKQFLTIVYRTLLSLSVFTTLFFSTKPLSAQADDLIPTPAPEANLPVLGAEPLNAEPLNAEPLNAEPLNAELVTASAPFEVRLAWFYKPPIGTTLANLAGNFDFFIMSKGDESVRDQLVALGARKPILQYLRAEAIHDPGNCTSQPWRNNVAYLPGDFCTISKDHPDWFLLDQKGNRINDPYESEKFYLMDPMNPEWQAFYVERVRQVQSDPHWDGVFLDNVEVSLSFREQQKKVPAKYSDDASYQNAVQGLLKVLYTTYFKPNGKLLYANIVARQDETQFPSYLTYLDGAMHEGWSIDDPDRWRSVSTWEKQMTLAEQVQAQGKFIILVGQGEQDDAELQRFAFASWLLVANGRSAFRYANSSNYRQAWMYSNYQLNLGQPLGPRYQDGDAWRRDFTNGSVMVNPSTHTVEINAPTFMQTTLYLPISRK